VNTLRILLELVVGLGILNVWILRSGKATSYRGGDARTLREEFAAYGLPFWFFCLVGVLKVTTALALLCGIWIPVLVRPSAMVMAFLMLGAFLMHVKVKDPMAKSWPSLAVLLMCLTIVLL
jgi:uncharacterized membrane protein YphA (DoxX/SURF4 family)